MQDAPPHALDAASPRAPDLSRRLRDAAAFAVTTLAIWLAHLRLPVAPAGPELDASWEQALGRALVRGLRWGRDIWFTHGPLGAFPYGRYEPALFDAKLYGWELALKGALAGFLALAVLRVPGVVPRLAALAAILLVSGGEDAYAAAATLAVLLACLDARPGRGGALVVPLGVACLAALSLAKLTWLAGAAVAVLAVAVARGRRAPLDGAVVLLGYGLALLVLWLSCGQTPADAGAYLASSWRLASEYSSAMALVGSRVELDLAVAAAGLVLAAAALRLARTRELRDACLLVAAGALVFLAFKSGLTRHQAEANRFFAFAALAPLLLASRARPRSSRHPTAGAEPGAARLGRIELAATALAFLAGAGGFALALDDDPRSGRLTNPAERLHALGDLLDPRELETRLVVERDRLRDRWALPRVREEIGTASVDLLGASLGQLFLAELDWRPRPVFQSYAAYSPLLMEANAAFYEGPRAPRYVLLDPGRIDRRYPLSADASAVIAVLASYEPLFWEKGHLLFRRRERVPALPPPEVVLRTGAALGERVELVAGADASEVLLLRLRLRPTLEGRLATLALREPELHLDTTLSDGTRHRFRLVRGAFEQGVPASPLLLTSTTWNEWYLDEEPLAVRALRVDASPAARRAFEDEVEVELVRLDLSATPRQGVPQVLTLPSFFPQPARIVSRRPASRRRIGGRPALVVHAPSKLTYELEPGLWRLRGSYGFAERDDGALPGNAARFAAALRPLADAGDGGGGPRIVLEDTLLHRPGDPEHPAVAFDVELDLEHATGRTELVLLTAPAAGHEGDAAFWRDVTIERVGSPAHPR